MFPVTPQPLGCNMLYPLDSQMQEELGSSCSSYPFPNYLYSGHWGVHHQYGTNEPAPNISESWGLTPYNPDDCFRYKYSSQNNLALDDETQENMVSVKDNGSCRSSDAIAEVSENSQDIFYLLIFKFFQQISSCDNLQLKTHYTRLWVLFDLFDVVSLCL